MRTGRHLAGTCASVRQDRTSLRPRQGGSPRRPHLAQLASHLVTAIVKGPQSETGLDHIYSDSSVLTGGVGTWEYGESAGLSSSSGVARVEWDTNWNRESQSAWSMQRSLRRERKGNHRR